MSAALNNSIRHRPLVAGPNARVSLSYYPPGLEQPSHRHSQAQLSFILLGQLAEVGDRGSPGHAGSRQGYHQAGARHQVRFGSQGGLILAIQFPHTVETDRAPIVGWRTPHGSIPGLCRSLVSGESDVLDEVVAAAAMRDSRVGRVPPPWLVQAAERIREEPETSIASIATEIGIHRGSLARSFLSYFGMPPTTFRLQCKVERALAATLDDGLNGANAAAAASFADQSHWIRSCRQTIGLSTGDLQPHRW